MTKRDHPVYGSEKGRTVLFINRCILHARHVRVRARYDVIYAMGFGTGKFDGGII